MSGTTSTSKYIVALAAFQFHKRTDCPERLGVDVKLLMTAQHCLHILKKAQALLC